MDVAKTFGLIFLGFIAGTIFKEEYHFPTDEKISKAYIDYKSFEKTLEEDSSKPN